MVDEGLENKEIQERPKMTKGEIFLFLAGMNCTFLAHYLSAGKEVKEDPRKYRNILSGEYSRIERDTLKNLCSFLGVSTDLVLDGLYDDMNGSVYIHNQKIWISFNEYILLKCTGHITEYVAKGKNGCSYIRHGVLVSDIDFRKDTDYMKTFIDSLNGEIPTIRQKIYRPLSYLTSIRGIDSVYCNEQKYETIIKPYFLEILKGDEKTKEMKFENLLQRTEQKNAANSIKSFLKENIDFKNGKTIKTSSNLKDLAKFLAEYMADKEAEYKEVPSKKNSNISRLANSTLKKDNFEDNPFDPNPESTDNNDNSDK